MNPPRETRRTDARADAGLVSVSKR